MSYRVALAPEALGDLQKLPAAIEIRVEQALSVLAENPSALSRPSHFPYAQCQGYELHFHEQST
jgi:mRNA-degrading endonuclease RelE of RelBE toxin-antitoxin system